MNVACSDYSAVSLVAPGRFPARRRTHRTGAYLDATGLYKLGERYYDPQHGRFTQQDPIVSPADPMQWNRYVYVGNNPINYTDPTGMWRCGAWEAIGAAVGLEASFLVAEAGELAVRASFTGSGLWSASKILGSVGRNIVKIGSKAVAWASALTIGYAVWKECW